MANIYVLFKHITGGCGTNNDGFEHCLIGVIFGAANINLSLCYCNVCRKSYIWLPLAAELHMLDPMSFKGPLRFLRGKILYNILNYYHL